MGDGMKPDIERRAFAELRASGDEKPKIDGYAAVFNSLSEQLPGFREIILPGAFDRALKESHDVRALVNHDPNQIIGRTKSGTLKLSVDDKGLRAEIDPDMQDPDAAKTVRRIQRGDLDGMSFAFRTIKDRWRTEDGGEVRELVDLELLDVSVVAYPAYTATQVSARALEHVRACQEPKGVPNEINAARLRMEE